MIKNVEPITSTDFNKGLVTRGDFLKGDINASPNTMDVQWRYDSVLQKRLGASSVNSVTLSPTVASTTGGWTLDTDASLSTGIQSYWKLDEASGDRADNVGSLSLIDFIGVPSVVGLRNQAVDFSIIKNSCLSATIGSSLSVASGESFSLHLYINFKDTGNFSAFGQNILGIDSNGGGTTQILYLGKASSGGTAKFQVQMPSGSGGTINFLANSFGALNTGQWYSVVIWSSAGSHVGISVNKSIDTINTMLSNITNSDSSGKLYVGSQNTGLGTMYGAIDEVGFWKKVLSAQERSDLYGGGSGNTYSGVGQGAATSFGWASFDFGASSIRWLTVAAGTGLFASSNRGTTFVTIATTRTASYQYLDRSKNVLIATSDEYDVPLYWAGSVGTFAATLAPNSAPQARFSINYNGFLALLNSKDSNGTLNKRRFSYANENLQLTDAWTNQFDFPSSADDEVTSAFVLYKFLYVSTRYKIFRVSFVGGNPDWSYLQIKNWGFVPRTAKLVSLKGGGQVVIGMDWDRRIRMFDGFDDLFISDNIENNNGLCDFAINKISYAGSGLQICHAELNPVTQEYRLNVAIGANSTQTTHSIVLNARNLAFYPYSNQGWQTMCVAESNNQRALMAVDRSGFCYILDSGNLDSAVAIPEVYDSPPLFSKIPEMVSKGSQINFFFAPKSSGTVYYQSRVDLSNQWGAQVPLSNSKGETAITGTENLVKVLRTVDVKETYNTYQFRIATSSGTVSSANPWELDRLDFLQQGFGIGKGN